MFSTPIIFLNVARVLRARTRQPKDQSEEVRPRAERLKILVPPLSGDQPPTRLTRIPELTGYVHLWEGTRAFTTRQRLLSADQYEIVDVRTDRGMTRAMLFPKAILKAEWDAAAPLRDGLTNRRERWRRLQLEKGKNGQRPRRVKPINRERAPAFSAALTPGPCLNASKHKGSQSKNLFSRPGTLCNGLRLHGAAA
jgi:hypothetical protein